MLAKNVAGIMGIPAAAKLQRYDNRKSTCVVPMLVNFDVLRLLLARGRRYSPVG